MRYTFHLNWEPSQEIESADENQRDIERECRIVFKFRNKPEMPFLVFVLYFFRSPLITAWLCKHIIMIRFSLSFSLSSSRSNQEQQRKSPLNSFGVFEIERKWDEQKCLDDGGVPSVSHPVSFVRPFPSFSSECYFIGENLVFSWRHSLYCHNVTECGAVNLILDLNLQVIHNSLSFFVSFFVALSVTLPTPSRPTTWDIPSTLYFLRHFNTSNRIFTFSTNKIIYIPQGSGNF